MLALLILGIVLFIGIHSVRLVAPGYRDQRIASRGEGAWKGLYSLLSLVGLIAIIAGYWLARDEAVTLFEPPLWSRTFLLVAMTVSLILVIASQLPAGRIKSGLRHPMMIGVLLWSLAHLIGNGDAASLVLFGGFALWAIVYLPAAYQRPRTTPASLALWPDIAAVAGGVVLTFGFMHFLHEWLIGVAIV